MLCFFKDSSSFLYSKIVVAFCRCNVRKRNAAASPLSRIRLPDTLDAFRLQLAAANMMRLLIA